jgi:hypothetical protein
MFKTIVSNMEDARERGDLVQGWVIKSFLKLMFLRFLLESKYLVDN